MKKIVALLILATLLSCGGEGNIPVIAKGTGFNINENLVKGDVTIFYFSADW